MPWPNELTAREQAGRPYNLLDWIVAARQNPVTRESSETAAFYNRQWWQQPTPNTLATQVLWGAIPAMGRYLKFFSGRPKGTFPADNTFGYQGMGLMLFRGLIARTLRAT